MNLNQEAYESLKAENKRLKYEASLVSLASKGVADAQAREEALRSENERLQAVNDTLKATLDSLGSVHAESQHDLAETRRALDEARAHSVFNFPKSTATADRVEYKIQQTIYIDPQAASNLIKAYFDALLAAADKGMKP